MRNILIGIFVGIVLGIVLGATVIAPRLKQQQVPMAEAGGDHAGAPESPKDVALQLSKGLLVRPAIQFRMASAYSSETPVMGALAQRLSTEVWRVSNGRVQIGFHEPDTLVPVADMFGAVASGTIDAAFSSPAMWADREFPAASLFGAVPFGPGPDEYLAWIFFGGGQQLLTALYHKRGVHGVVCGMAGPPGFGWFRDEIRTVEDLKGLPMRISGLGAEVMGRLGVETTQLAGGALFSALEAGRIDAVAHSMPAVDRKLGFQEFLKNYYFPGWQQPTILLELIVNLDKWRSLNDAQKAQIEAVCGDNIRHGVAESEASQFAALKELYAEGVRLHRWPAGVQSALEQAWKDVVDEQAGTDADFRMVWRSLKTFREEYAIWSELSAPAGP
jgi:TRAP-type mannitol/chloroaromatic compound transport system substrate-binding protein